MLAARKGGSLGGQKQRHASSHLHGLISNPGFLGQLYPAKPFSLSLLKLIQLLNLSDLGASRIG